MRQHVERNTQGKGQAVAHQAVQQRKTAPAYQFVDDERANISAVGLKNMVNNSARVQQLKAYQQMAYNSPQASQLRAYQAMAQNFSSATIQKKPGINVANGPVQFSGQVIQRVFIGDAASYHMHIGIAQPHYKRGRNVGTRIDVGPDVAYRVADLQRVIDLLRGNADADAVACYEWCLAEASAIHEANSPKAARRAAAKRSAAA